MSPIVIDTHRATAPNRPGVVQEPAPTPAADGLDPVITAARAAGRLAGERLARTPLTPRQRAVVASVMGGGAR